MASTHQLPWAQVSTPSDYYAELGYSPLQIKINGQDDVNPDAMRIIFGKNINKNLAVEGMYAFTVDTDHQPTFDGKSNHYGIALKPKVAIGEKADLFARIGYAHSNTTTSALGEKSTDDWTYAVGLEGSFTSDVYGQFDYTQYTNKNGMSVRGIGLAVGVRF